MIDLKIFCIKKLSNELKRGALIIKIKIVLSKKCYALINYLNLVLNFFKISVLGMENQTNLVPTHDPSLVDISQIKTVKALNVSKYTILNFVAYFQLYQYTIVFLLIYQHTCKQWFLSYLGRQIGLNYLCYLS